MERKKLLSLLLDVIVFYIVFVSLELIFKNFNWFDMGQRSVKSIFIQGFGSIIIVLAIKLGKDKLRKKKTLKTND